MNTQPNSLAGLRRVANSLGIAPAPVPAMRPAWLGQIAKSDPQLAWLWLQAGAPGGLPDTGGWETFNLEGTFTDGTEGEVVEASSQGLIEADLWVRQVDYTVRRPNAYAGSILKSQSDEFNKRNPGIGFTFTVNSYCRYLISPEPTPLENIKSVFDCKCPAGLVLRCNASIQSTFTLLRTLDLENGEIPMNVVITLHATRLPLGMYGQCGRDQAIAMLEALGYYQP